MTRKGWRGKGSLFLVAATIGVVGLLVVLEARSRAPRALREDKDKNESTQESAATRGELSSQGQPGDDYRENVPTRVDSPAHVTVLLPDHGNRYRVDGTLFVDRIGEIEKRTVPITGTIVEFRVPGGDYRLSWMVPGLGIHAETVSVSASASLRVDFRHVRLAEYEPRPTWARLEARVQTVDGLALQGATVHFDTLVDGGRSLRRRTNEVGECFAYTSPAWTAVRCGSFSKRIAAASGTTHTIEIPGERAGQFGEIVVSGDIDLRIRPRGDKRWWSHALAEADSARRFAVLMPGLYELGHDKIVLGVVQVRANQIAVFVPTVGTLVLRLRFKPPLTATEMPSLVFIRITGLSAEASHKEGHNIGWVPKSGGTVVVSGLGPGIYRIESGDSHFECHAEHVLKAGMKAKMEIALRPVGE